jgi:hypothetical protein
MYTTVVVWSILLLAVSEAHSWVECAYVVRDDTLAGEPGFPRGNGTSFVYQENMGVV